jgi:Domain of unknown function (DUF5615)
LADFYADENFRYPVVEALRRRGHDVLTCQEAGRGEQKIPDLDVLADANALGRIVLTQNRGDFKQLHQLGLPHVGIVNCSYDPDTEGHARRIEEAVCKETPGERWLVRVTRANLGGAPRPKKP